MSYDLRITRWPDLDRGPITREEWLALVASDPELTLDSGAGYSACWNGISGQSTHWIYLYEGTIRTKNPSRDLVGKLIQLAQRLGARVRGDEGEYYDSMEQID